MSRMRKVLTWGQISLARAVQQEKTRKRFWRGFGGTLTQGLLQNYRNDKLNYNFLQFYRYMKPLLTNSRPTLFETLPAFCTPIARILTTTEQLTQSGCTRKLDSDSDLCIDDGNGNGTRRNSISRVSIRLDDSYMASYKNRE